MVMEDQKRILFWNDKELYELKTRQIVLASLRYPACKMWMVSMLDHFMSGFTIDRTIEALKTKQFDVGAVARRDEHGRLWGRQAEWMKMISACHELGIKTLNYDFGYFDHYNTFMVDTYDSKAYSSIKLDWPFVSDKVDWNSTPEYVQKYRNKFLKLLNKAKNDNPINNLKSGEYVVIWPQYSMDLVRPEFREGLDKQTEVTDWVNKICKMVKAQGLVPVVKGGPAMEHWGRMNIHHITDAPVFTHTEKQLNALPNAIFEKDINHKLIAHAKYHVVSCSSVTNELVLADVPVIATGESWFTGLDIFNEPSCWDNLLDNPLYINQTNRNKWINWWLSRQVPKDDACNKFVEIYDKYPILKAA
jgi:hypothetical protein